MILPQVTQEVTKALQGYVTCKDDPVGMVERGCKPRYLGPELGFLLCWMANLPRVQAELLRKLNYFTEEAGGALTQM